MLWGFFKISFKNSFAYRTSVVIGIIGAVFAILVQIALWSFVFSKSSEMIHYMVSYVVVSTIIGQVYSTFISDKITEKIANGDFSLDLIKPISFIFSNWAVSLGNTAANIFIRCIPIILIFGPFSFFSGLNVINIFLFFIILVFGYIIITLLNIMVGYSAFIFIETWPYSRLVNDTVRFFSGAVIPLSFYPGWLQNIADILPFRFVYYFPIQVLLGKVEFGLIINNLFLMICWVLVLSFLLFIISGKAVKYCIVQGG